MSEGIIRQQYDQIARQYNQRWSTYIFKTLSFLNAWSAIDPQAVVLDLGCGTGEFEELMLSQQPRQQIVGVDISSKMLEMVVLQKISQALSIGL